MMSSISKQVYFGSATWLGADSTQRASQLRRDTNWEYLIKICCELRQLQCHLVDKISIGHLSMERRILFEDGKSWLVRLRIPDLEGFPAAQDLKMALSAEVACLKFLREQSSTPVPDVYGFETDANKVGAPYIIMEYIPGTVANELRYQIGAPRGQYGTIDQDKTFRRQMAALQVKLASLKFDRIGSLYQDPQSGGFYIGPDSHTGHGPWDSSFEYYRYIANQKLEECLQRAPEEVCDDYSFSLPVLFERLITTHTEDVSGPGSFGLTDLYFGAHNILVNERFEILAINDLSGVISGPIEVQAQFPTLTELDVEPPLDVETEAQAIERINLDKPKLEEYRRMIQEHEQEIQAGCDTVKAQGSLGDLLFSDTSAMVAGLHRYEMHQVFVNQRWLLSFSRLLRRKLELGIGETDYGGMDLDSPQNREARSLEQQTRGKRVLHLEGEELPASKIPKSIRPIK